MTDLSPVALKPCPFCGSTDLKSGGDDKIVGTWCLTCEAFGPNEYGSRATWNLRTASAPEEVERPLSSMEAGADAVAWRCFHCDEVFTSEHDARLHFGRDEGCTPACLIKGADGGLVAALRRAENDAAEAWFAIHNETTDAARGFHAQAARHREQIIAVEQAGYDRGIADAKAHPETLGLTRLPTSPREAEGA